MKVCIPIEKTTSGGPLTFFHKFSNELKNRNIQVTQELTKECDVVLAIMYAPIPLLRQAKKMKIPIVQRLDGVYYPAVAPLRWLLLNYPRWVTYRFFANSVIFQSEFSELSCRRFLGKPRCPTTLIYNGVNLTKFRPDGPAEKITSGRTIFSLLSSFRQPFEILTVLSAYDNLKKTEPDIQLAVAGHFARSARHIPETRPDIHWLGLVPNETLPNIYRGSELLLSAKLRAPCPNIVIESMSSGLPIACFDSGAHVELLGDEAGICAPLQVKGDVFARYTPNEKDIEHLTNAAQTILENRPQFSYSARKRVEKHFSLTLMVDKYVEVFEKSLSLYR
jgi:glycosyltransferase involved in cell wall biosynthesis